MKIMALLSILAASAAVSFGQKNLQIQVPGSSRIATLSAVSISRVADSLRDYDREKVIAMRKELADLTSIYTRQHPSVMVLQREINRLEGALKGYKRIIQLRGAVEIRTDAITLLADEADYDEDTGEIEARGNVRVKPSR